MYPEEETIRYYVLYMDVVKSSDRHRDLEEQIDRMSEFNRILRRILLPDNITDDGSPPWKIGYYGSTGDGAVICFNLIRDPFTLSSWLLQEIAEYNKKLPDNSKSLSIQLRMGISGGETLLLTRFDNTTAPWGRDMVIAKRIMDMANPDQILVSEGTKEQIAQFSKDYKFKHMGEHIVKHGEIVNVYSFTFEDRRGNKMGNDETILCECHRSKNDSILIKDQEMQTARGEEKKKLLLSKKVGERIEQHGLVVTVFNVDFWDDKTEVFLKIENETDSEVSIFVTSSFAKQNKRQARCVHPLKIRQTIPQGIVEDGSIYFEPLDPSNGNIDFHFDFYPHVIGVEVEVD